MPVSDTQLLLMHLIQDVAQKHGAVVEQVLASKQATDSVEKLRACLAQVNGATA
jgi:hypothetical protein